jgi:hypothetical protein
LPPDGTGARSRTERGTDEGPKVRTMSSTTCPNSGSGHVSSGSVARGLNLYQGIFAKK